MKKLLTIFIASILLTGCVNSTKKDTKLCNITVDDIGLNMELMIRKAEKDKIKDVEFTMKTPSLLEILDIDEKISQEEMQKLQEQMINEINTEILPGVGADIFFTEDHIICTSTIDLEQADETVLEHINYKNDLSYTDYITQLESVGYTCK